MTIQKRINVPDIDLLHKNHHKHKLHVGKSSMCEHPFCQDTKWAKHRFCKPHQVEVDNKIEEERIQKEIAKRNRRY